MHPSTREILVAWACCGLVALGALLVETPSHPANPVFTGVHIPGRSVSAASTLSIEDEFADDGSDDAGIVASNADPPGDSEQRVAESQRCWLRSFARRLL